VSELFYSAHENSLRRFIVAELIKQVTNVVVQARPGRAGKTRDRSIGQRRRRAIGTSLLK
jgi:hypothetical protein